MSAEVGIAETPQQDSVNLQAEELPEQVVDVERFKAVPEHSGNLQSLIEQYRNNPGRCPFMESMGKAGIQLLQKLAESEKNPDRGPTIRETMEAKKKESQSLANAHNKPNATKDTGTINVKKTEISTDEKSDGILPSDKSVNHLLVQEQARRGIVVETIDPPTIPSDMPPSETNEQRVERLSEDLPKSVIIKAEHILHQHAIELAESQRAEVKQIHSPTILASEISEVPTITQTPIIENILPIDDHSKSKKQADTVREPTREGYARVVFKEDNSSILGTNDEDPDITLQVKVDSTEEPIFNIDERMADPVLDHQAQEVSEVIKDTNIISKFDANQADIEEVESDVQPFNSKVKLSIASDETIDLPEQVREEGLRFLTKTLKQREARVELNTYTETIESERAEVTEMIHQTLVEVLEASQIAIENGEEISERDVKKIEHLFVETPESLNLDYQDETVKKIVQDLFSPEIIAKITEEYELSIDQLNYLGTREYKTNSVASPLTSLVGMIKKKIESHLRLGKYVLSASMA
jgi:hypothetical protein